VSAVFLIQNKLDTKMKIKIIILTVLLFFILSNEGLADISHVVISEIMIKGTDDSEFIELYNPTDNDMKMKNWYFTYYSSARDWNNPYRKKEFPNDSIIKSRSYFLIGLKGYDESISDWQPYSSAQLSNTKGSATIFHSGTFSKENASDSVAWGKVDYVKEDKEASVPGTGKSIERKTVDNEIRDTDNNENDFILSNPNPQNSSGNNNEDGNDNNKDEDKKYSTSIKINELFPNPEESPEKKNEFVELYNFGDDSIDFAGWSIEDKTGSYKLAGAIDSQDYIAFYNTVTLNNNGDEIKLLNPSGGIVSQVPYGKAAENYSYSFDGKKWQWTSFMTPSEENKFEVKKEYSNKVYLNEILPNPSGDEKTGEYIEIYNPAKNKIDLAGWILRDSSKTGKYVLLEKAIIKTKGYLVIYRVDFKFALNNSGNEMVYLLDPNESIVASIAYSKAKEDVSYNFDGEDWRWSRFLTPGKENKFNKLPKIQVKIDKKIYKNIYADFEVKINDPDKDKTKIVWNFGDGRKSYKRKTRHKYKETGDYKASIKVNDGSEDIIKKFNVKVKNFPRPKVRITRLSPNPEGKDSENEWIEVKNKSKKDVNLKNWSIATGKSSKKLINHPIYEDFIIKPGETEKITRGISKFSLNNKKSRIELRYPDGRVAHKAKYKRKDGVKEDEIYEKVKGEGWKWSQIAVNVKDIEGVVNISIVETEEPFDFAQGREIYEEIPEEFLGKQSMDPNRKDFRIILAAYQTNTKLYSGIIENKGKILGASTIKENGSNYVFTSNNYMPESHYIVKFFKSLGLKINSSVNKIILMLI